MAPIEIYGMQGIAPCRIVEMTAECLGLEYEFKVVNLQAGENRTPEYLAMNPQVSDTLKMEEKCNPVSSLTCAAQHPDRQVRRLHHERVQGGRRLLGQQVCEGR